MQGEYYMLLFKVAWGTCWWWSLSTDDCTVNKSVNHLFDCFLVFRAGGPWLITDMDRIESIFEINPDLQVKLLLGILDQLVKCRLLAIKALNFHLSLLLCNT